MHSLPPRTSVVPVCLAVAAVAGALALPAAPARAQTSAKAGIVTTTLFVPDGVAKLKGVLAFTGVGTGAGWPGDPEFRAMAKRLELGVVAVRGEKSSGDDASYPFRCARGEFKMLLDSLTELGKVSNHPELANAPIIGGGHSHGGDYWNYFNACYPERMALVFCKSSGGVQYTRGALRTPMVWEIGTNDLRDSRGNFRGQMLAHRSKGSQIALVLGPGENHGSFTAGSRQMVIDLIEAIFKLRMPADADPAKGPVTLLDIDEAKGGYWLGDNYSKEIGPYPTFPGKTALQKTSFLPNEEVAKKWKAYGAALPAAITIDDGFCSHCYKQLADEPPLKPLNTAGTPVPPPPNGSPPPATDAGEPVTGSPADAGPAADGGPTPSPDTAAPAGETKLDAASAPAPPRPAPPATSPPPADPGDDPTAPRPRTSGGCTVGAGAPNPVALWLLGLLTAGWLPLARRARARSRATARRASRSEAAS